MAKTREYRVTSQNPVDSAPASLVGLEDRNGTTALTGSSQGLRLPKGAKIVRVASPSNFWYAWGYGSAATASASVKLASLFPAGVEQLEVPRNASGRLAEFISVLQVGTGDTGPVSVEKLG